MKEIARKLELAAHFINHDFETKGKVTSASLVLAEGLALECHVALYQAMKEAMKEASNKEEGYVEAPNT